VIDYKKSVKELKLRALEDTLKKIGIDTYDTRKIALFIITFQSLVKLLL
jgi:hypothetical protein